MFSLPGGITGDLNNLNTFQYFLHFLQWVCVSEKNTLMSEKDYFPKELMKLSNL